MKSTAIQLSLLVAGAFIAPQLLFSTEQQGSVEWSVTERVLSPDSAIREQAIENLIKSRKQMISELIAIIQDPANRLQHPDSVSKAMLSLGELRAEEGIDVLVENIGYPEMPSPSQDKPIVSYRRMPSPVIEDRLPAVAALTKIGEKCVPEVISKLAITEIPVEVAACVRVLQMLKQNVPVDTQIRAAIKRASGPAKQRLEHAKKLLQSQSNSAKPKR